MRPLIFIKRDSFPRLIRRMLHIRHAHKGEVLSGHMNARRGIADTSTGIREKSIPV
jgi:hypothetical protein